MKSTPIWKNVSSFANSAQFMQNASNNLNKAIDPLVLRLAQEDKQQRELAKLAKQEDKVKNTGDIISQIFAGKKPNINSNNYDSIAVSKAIYQKKEADHNHKMNIINSAIKNAQLQEQTRHNKVSEKISEMNIGINKTKAETDKEYKKDKIKLENKKINFQKDKNKTAFDIVENLGISRYKTTNMVTHKAGTYMKNEFNTIKNAEDSITQWKKTLEEDPEKAKKYIQDLIKNESNSKKKKKLQQILDKKLWTGIGMEIKDTVKGISDGLTEVSIDTYGAVHNLSKKEINDLKKKYSLDKKNKILNSNQTIMNYIETEITNPIINSLEKTLNKNYKYKKDVIERVTVRKNEIEILSQALDRLPKDRVKDRGKISKKLEELIINLKKEQLKITEKEKDRKAKTKLQKQRIIDSSKAKFETYKKQQKYKKDQSS